MCYNTSMVVPLSPQHIAILATIALGLVAVGGDYFLKLASDATSPFATRSFYIGLTAHASAAFGWVLVMRELKLVYVAIFYSVPIVVALAIIGHFAFGERLNSTEILGVLLALVSLVLLSRVS